MSEELQQRLTTLANALYADGDEWSAYDLLTEAASTLATERTAREAAEADRDHARARRLEAEEDLRTSERTLDDTLARAEAAEAAVARMREGIEQLAAKWEAAATGHSLHAVVLRARAAELRALLEGGV